MIYKVLLKDTEPRYYGGLVIIQIISLLYRFDIKRLQVKKDQSVFEICIPIHTPNKYLRYSKIKTAPALNSSSVVLKMRSGPHLDQSACYKDFGLRYTHEPYIDILKTFMVISSRVKTILKQLRTAVEVE